MPSSSSLSPHDPGETKTTSRTDEALPITLKQFTSTIKQFGIISQTLGDRIEGFNSRFDDLEGRLGSMEHRMDNMKDSMNNLSKETEDLVAKFKTTSEYLLEVIKGEQIAMQEISDLASRCHE